MEMNLKFLLSLGDTKLIMLNCAGKNVFYSKDNSNTNKRNLTKISALLQTR